MSDKKKVLTKDKMYDNLCFVIMPISQQHGYDDDKDHFTRVYEQIFTPAIKKAGFEPYRVDENKISDSIIDKIFNAVQNCPMALCDLSARNPNVLYELGLRQAYNLPVVLVKDNKTSDIFDVSGISTVSYSSHRLVENVEQAVADISEALIATKEGRVNTVAEIVKAKTASYDKVQISEQDNINILLKGIMSEIRDIKKTQQIDSVQEFNRLYISDAKNKELFIRVIKASGNLSSSDIICESANFASRLYEVNVVFDSMDGEEIIKIIGDNESKVINCYNWLEDTIQQSGHSIIK